jgi:hypothetical protein
MGLARRGQGATQAMSMYIVEERQRSRCPRGARNAMPPNTRTDSWSVGFKISCLTQLFYEPTAVVPI